MARFLALLAAAVTIALAAAPGAQGQACPSKICDASFANAMGGPVDCCAFDYSKAGGVGGRCQWAGTPVSFRLVRTCTQDGASYKVLTKSNTQAPPASDECRCASGKAKPANSLPQPVTDMCVKLVPRQGMDIPGQDIPCDNQPHCLVCGNVQAVRDECAKRPTCVAFTFEVDTQCGYLKTGTNGMKSRFGWSAFTRG